MSELTADKTFYVRIDGLDTNNGLTSGNAFLTPHRAAEETQKWRTGEFTLTVDIGKGRFYISESLDPGHPDGHNIVWTGVATEHTDNMVFEDITYAVITPDPPAQTAGYFYATIDDASELPSTLTGAHALIRGASGDTDYHFLNGAHAILSWVEAEKKGRLSWAYNSKSNIVLGDDSMTVESLTVVETELWFLDVPGLRSSSGMHCGNWDKMLVTSANMQPDPPVVWMSDRSEIVLGPNFVTYRGAPALLCQSNAVINADSSFHVQTYVGPFALAETGGFISLRGAIVNSSSAEAVIARDNGTIDLQGAELYCTGYPHSVVATRCGSINAANTTVLGCAPTGSVAFYMDTEGYIDSTDATDDAETSRHEERGPAPGVTGLDADKTIYVRADGDDSNDGTSADNAFLTPAKALEEVKKYFIGEYLLHFNVGEGTFNCSAALSPASNEGANIVWTGDAVAHTSLTINNIDGSTTNLSTGLEYIDFDVNFAPGSGASVGQYILVKTTSGGTNPNLVKGCHEIIAWSANVATVRCVRNANSTLLPSGTITANTLTLVKTVFDFNSASGGIFVSGDYRCGNWDNMVFKGDLVRTGVWLLDGASIVLGANFGTSKWGINLSSQLGASMHADGSVHSYAYSFLASLDGGGFASLRSGAILSGSRVSALRVFDNATLNFQDGQLYCGGNTLMAQAFRGGYLNARSCVIEGCQPSGSFAFYASSGGGIDATGATDDAETLSYIAPAPAGNGAYVAY